MWLTLCALLLQGKVLLCLIYNVYPEDCFSRAGLSQELSMPHPLRPSGMLLPTSCLEFQKSQSLGLVFILLRHSGQQRSCRGLGWSHFPLVSLLVFSLLNTQDMGRKKKPNTTTSGSAGRRLLHLNSWFIHSSENRQLCFPLLHLSLENFVFVFFLNP